MKELNRLSRSDFEEFKVKRSEAIALIKHYSCQYKGKEHYDKLGASCAMSVNATVNTTIGSAEYLDGFFLMPDEIQVERLADWFLNNKEYECDRQALLFYMAHYIKKKINNYYRVINEDGFIYTTAIAGNKETQKERRKQFQLRKSEGVKRIRC